MATMLAYLPPEEQAWKNSAREGVSSCCNQQKRGKGREVSDGGRWWEDGVRAGTYEDLCDRTKIVLELVVSVDDGTTDEDLGLDMIEMVAQRAVVMEGR